jgi:hypothetical protein
MRFEHIIQINSLDQPGLEVLTREQVWRGLALRAYDPAHFILGLEGCSIRNHSKQAGQEILERTLYFGSFEVNDRITLDPMEQTHTEVQATDKWPHCTATFRIEEPEPMSLFLRFTYVWDDTDAPGQQMDDQIRQAREQACQAADMDTVQRIREMSRQELS